MAQNIIDPELLELIRRTLQAGWISVYCDIAGDYKEYTVPLADDKLLILSRALVVSDATETIYDYTLNIAGQDIAQTFISSKNKMPSENDQVILSLFTQCAREIITQEMRALFHSHRDKKHSS